MLTKASLLSWAFRSVDPSLALSSLVYYHNYPFTFAGPLFCFSALPLVVGGLTHPFPAAPHLYSFPPPCRPQLLRAAGFLSRSCHSRVETPYHGARPCFDNPPALVHPRVSLSRAPIHSPTRFCVPGPRVPCFFVLCITVCASIPIIFLCYPLSSPPVRRRPFPAFLSVRWILFPSPRSPCALSCR